MNSHGHEPAPKNDNCFYAEWIPCNTKVEYRNTPVGQAVQILHSVTKTFVEPIQFVSLCETNGNIEIESLSEAGVYKKFTPEEYRHVRLVILQVARKEDYDKLPASRKVSQVHDTWTDYYEIRGVITDPKDQRLVRESQHVVVNSFLTDLHIFLHCGNPELSHYGERKKNGQLVSSRVEDEIWRKYPSLKDVKHPNKERLLLREPFYGVETLFGVELFDIMENYMGYMPYDTNNYVPSDFPSLACSIRMEKEMDLRLKNIECFIKEGKGMRRGKNITS